jgi:hypothetical protein
MGFFPTRDFEGRGRQIRRHAGRAPYNSEANRG